MRSRRLVAAAAVSAALLTGGVAGFVLGVPGVSGAQTADPTVPPSTDAPAGEAPPADEAPTRNREGCPDKGGRPAEDGAASGTAARGNGVMTIRRL